MSGLLERREQLRAALREAEQHRAVMQRLVQREQFEGPHIEEVDRLAAYHRGVTHRVPGVERDDEQRRSLEVDVAARLVQDPDLGLEPTPHGRNAWLIVSRKLTRELEAARAGEREAARVLEGFERDNRDEIAAVEDAERRGRVAAALESGSPEDIKEALGIGRPTALRTSDLSRG